MYVAAFLVAATVTCLMAGALGPDVLKVQNGSTDELVVNKNGEANLMLDVNGFNSFNQFFWINVEFLPQVDTSYTSINSIDILLNVTGSNPLLDMSANSDIIRDKHFSRDVTCSGSNCDEFFLFGQRQVFFETLKSKNKYMVCFFRHYFTSHVS